MAMFNSYVKLPEGYCLILETWWSDGLIVAMMINDGLLPVTRILYQYHVLQHVTSFPIFRSFPWDLTELVFFLFSKEKNIPLHFLEIESTGARPFHQGTASKWLRASWIRCPAFWMVRRLVSLTENGGSVWSFRATMCKHSCSNQENVQYSKTTNNSSVAIPDPMEGHESNTDVGQRLSVRKMCAHAVTFFLTLECTAYVHIHEQSRKP